MSDKGSIRLTLEPSALLASVLISVASAEQGKNIFSVTQLLRHETTPVSFIYSFQVFDSRKNWKVGKQTPKEILEAGILNLKDLKLLISTSNLTRGKYFQINSDLIKFFVFWLRFFFGGIPLYYLLLRTHPSFGNTVSLRHKSDPWVVY